MVRQDGLAALMSTPPLWHVDMARVAAGDPLAKAADAGRTGRTVQTSRLIDTKAFAA
jgi:hypothetical protein